MYCMRARELYLNGPSHHSERQESKSWPGIFLITEWSTMGKFLKLQDTPSLQRVVPVWSSSLRLGSLWQSGCSGGCKSAEDVGWGCGCVVYVLLQSCMKSWDRTSKTGCLSLFFKRGTACCMPIIRELHYLDSKEKSMQASCRAESGSQN